jgi:hypothetical protein
MPTRSALIVGVSTYASPDVPPLAGVAADLVSARRIAQAMGISPAQTTVLRDDQATKANILRALETLAAGAAEGSRVFLYFSGHGTRWFDPQRQGCMEGLLAHDRQTITNEEIASHTRRISEVADKVVVLFDACHSDGVSGNRAATRSIASGALTSKFFLKAGADAAACSQPRNLKTRSLLAEATRLGALSENFVQITSSRADEVSFDDAVHGGLATQSVRDCLLGQAGDLDGSGAVSVREVEQCAQRLLEQKLKPFPDLLPHHITVTGNRNLVPVAVSRPPPAAPAATPATPPMQATPPVAAAPATPARPNTPAAQATTTVAATPPAADVGPAASPAQAPAPAPNPAPAPALASLATLQEVSAQRNPRRKVDVSLSKPSLRIGQDALQLTVRASHAGHVYLVMLGSDRRSFYLLFPNALDDDNRIRANAPMTLPRPDWRLLAQGPAGTDHLLVLVTDTPRDLAALRTAPASAAAPFTFTLNDLPGRSALVDFFTGSGVRGQSEAFGARLLTLEEMP